MNCPNCGTPMQGAPEFCSACGMRLNAPQQPRDLTVHRVISMVLLILIAVPAGLLGGCFLVLGAGTEASIWGGVGVLLAIVLVAYCIWSYTAK